MSTGSEDATVSANAVEVADARAPDARRRPRWLDSWPALAGLGFVLLAFFWPVLFRNEQFGYRDAAHYYYPLYERVEQEWNAGRIPLWEPEENSGMPLLGNPTAAVLYPLKLIYRVAPSYAWGARIYTIVHVVLCYAGMYWLARWWSTSVAGSTLAALAYCLASPVLFQTCNIIFLVGAAWAPFGVWAIDAWIRRGRRWAIVALALVLALQVLGGDPEVAYVSGVFAALYALVLASKRAASPQPNPRRTHWVLLALGLAALWVVLTLGAAIVLKRTPEEVGKPPSPHPWSAYLSMAARAITVAAAVWVAIIAFRGRRTGVLLSMLGGLAVAAVAGALLCGAQLLPVLEFTSQSLRATVSGPHDVFPFSLEPARVAELAFPGFFGSASNGETLWLKLLTPDHTPEIWVTSIYCGGATLWLALVAMGWSKVSVQQRWLTLVLVLSLVAAFGKFSSPLWVARFSPRASEVLGPHDPPNTASIRFDGAARDGDGSVYAMMSALLPGFGAFRYPSKLLTFTCLAAAALAGLGWDGALAERRRRTFWIIGCAIAVALASLTALLLLRAPILERFERLGAKQLGGIFGPFGPNRAWEGVVASLCHAAIVAAALAVILIVGRRRPRIAGVLVVALQLADLTIANREHVISVPQSLFDTRPEMLDLIEQAEREKPTPGGYYRVYRIPTWDPYRWREIRDASRYSEFVRWERETLQPKYGIPYGLDYSFTKGVAELFDYEFFFTAFERSVKDRALARQIFGDRTDEKLVVYTRRGIDLWNSRYFILPYRLSNDESRGIAAFLSNIEPLAPPESLDDETTAQRDARLTRWVHDEDWRLLRNDNAYPRAWVVHNARVKAPIRGLDRKDRESLMFEILYPNDALWSDSVEAYDPRTIAWIETDDRVSIDGFVSRAPVLPSEQPRIVRYEPQRVEIEVELKTPGLVILADVNYPGWKLSLDGKPAEILRANRLMRGAAVPAGKHSLVYVYEPESLRLGLMASIAGLVSLAVLAAGALRWPQQPRLAT